MFKRYLDKGETLLFVINHHWITVKDQMLKIGIVGYLIPLSVIIFFTGLFNPISYFFYGWLILSLMYSIYAFLDWYLDAWLLTDVSIIETSWDGFFKQRSSRVEYTSVESVDVEVKGIKQTVLNYGNIHLIKSSGVNIRMEKVFSPHIAASWLSKIRGEALINKNVQNAESLKGLLAEIIESHIKVNSGILSPGLFSWE
ncbi:MAG: hypothetical protein AB7J46_05230 [Candidatus Altimarinota bacterium]